MNRLCLACALLAAASGPLLAAESEKFHFVATIQIDHEQRQTITVALKPGEKKSIDTLRRLRIEFDAPKKTDGSGKTAVRLLDTSGKSPVLKHQAKQDGRPSHERSFTYGVCHGKVTYLSPSPKTPFACSKT